MVEPLSIHDEESLGKAYDARLMRRLVAYVRPYRRTAVTAVALIVLSSLLQLVGPLATAVALDLFMHPEGAEATLSPPSRWTAEAIAAAGWRPGPFEGLAAVSAVYLATLAATFVVLYLQSRMMLLMGQHIMRDLRDEIFAHLQRLPLAYFDRNPVGRLSPG